MADLGLARYDKMCTAIAECHKIDEAKDIRDKARAIEVYAQQAKNTDAERKAAEIRIRAERKAGELLREMKETGKRAAPKDGASTRIARGDKSSPVNSAVMPKPIPPSLKDLGITPDQSSKWQALANVPAEEFEKAVKGNGPKPTTEGIINANSLRQKPMPRIDPVALWFWGRLRDFESDGVLDRKVEELVSGMTDSMRDDCMRIIPRLAEWLQKGILNGKSNRAA